MRSFISYSRSDRQRVLGLASLLDALGHAVFVDQRSIKAGRQWREELFVELERAEVLIVFWTRSASSSSWVRREFEYFNRRFPERPLIPITGDQTELPSDLKTRQSVSFFPLINELFEISSNLRAQRISRRKIRAVLLERLREEGIDLTERSRRNRILALFGVASFSPLLFTPSISDVVVGRISRLPVSHILTGGSAAVVGVVVCQNLDSPADLLLTPDLHQVPIRAGQSGTDACEADGLICVSVDRVSIRDPDGRFFGYSTPTCSSRVVRATAATGCWDLFRTRYAYEDVVLQKSPDADDDVSDFPGYNFFCLIGDKGRLGIHEFANCVKP